MYGYCQNSLNQYEQDKMGTYRSVWLKYEKISIFSTSKKKGGSSKKKGGVKKGGVLFF